MKTINRFYALLALLLTGSAGAWAQTDDPFPEVNDSKYSESMTIIGKVRLDGEILGNETIIAIYQGDEIRGKDTPFDQGSRTNIFSINIYGETNGQALHFKVFTEGRVIEVDQGLTFNINDVVGKPSDPYFIDLPVPFTTTIDENGWATTCLPYNAQIPDGVTAYAVTALTAGGNIDKEKIEGDILPANTPVVLQSDGGGTFEWLSRVASADQPESNLLTGTTEPIEMEPGTVLTFGLGGADGTVPGFWRNTESEIPGNSAYINNPPGGAEGYALDDSYDAITAITAVKTAPVYDLQGRKADASRRGLYIQQNRKFIVR